MAGSILTRKLFEVPPPNWWLWMCLSLPPGFYLLLVPQDDHGWMVSNWGYFTHWMYMTGHLSPFTVDRHVLSQLGSVLFENFWAPLALGLLAQYVLTFICRRLRRSTGDQAAGEHTI